MDKLEIICLGSGSSGNCYLLGKGDEYIMVECGLPYKTIIKRMEDYGIALDQIKALVVSHAHKDHALSIVDFELLGVPIFAPYREQVEIDLTIPHTLTKWMRVRAFAVKHDVPCYGFIFLTCDKESLLFVTDTRYFESPYFEYRYTYIMIECNHIRKQLETIMDKALIEGNQAKVFKFKRQASFHLSLAGVKKILKKVDLDSTLGIFLIHLSKDCCNDDVIRKEIQNVFNTPTYVCYRDGGIH